MDDHDEDRRADHGADEDVGDGGDLVIELLDQSASTALVHAAELQEHLRVVDRGHAGVAECHAEMHRLVADIVSLRNAAELLKRRAEPIDVVDRPPRVGRRPN